jgi:hypothetical protein
MIVKLSNFGSSLSSRLQAREVFRSIKSEVICSKEIILDFEKIQIMTMSFGTELFDSINENSNCEVRIINSNEFLNSVIKFCRSKKKKVAC